ncbi:hypothetical protein HF078_12570 [Bacillus sp. RO2]|uniref:hypothetical protein n=1 Tax=Bacillus sp. RO2 TaxID=2723913 RepID=UPI00145C502A|nr:hypothetical protein [Bacillus sp. RO2]NMH73918.1 hypothetical protein [Bacillus sp. RO2]
MRRVHILNTNKSYDKTCEEDMLRGQKCSAYFGHWKHLIETIKMGDLVFLYSNGNGIIARGVATGIVEIADYQGKENEEYYMHLDRFEILNPYLSSTEIKIVTNMNIDLTKRYSTLQNMKLV